MISANSGNLINHWSMNWAQYKDPVSHMCLAGAVVTSWSFAPEGAGSSPLNDKYFWHWIQWKHLEQECIPVGCVLPTAVTIGGPGWFPLNFSLGCGPGPDLPQLPPWVWAWTRSPSTPPPPFSCGAENIIITIIKYYYSVKYYFAPALLRVVKNPIGS